jgi:tRNA (Thr-GGU) A37 N-methylase
VARSGEFQNRTGRTQPGNRATGQPGDGATGNRAPRDDPTNPLCGVFDTRSPDRPNPVGLHRARVLELAPAGLKVGPLEAIDGTPVVDLKPVLAVEER